MGFWGAKTMVFQACVMRFFHKNFTGFQDKVQWIPFNSMERSTYNFIQKLRFNIDIDPDFDRSLVAEEFRQPMCFQHSILNEIQWNAYFITLTVCEKSYKEVFIEQPGSTTMSHFLNKFRNYVRRGTKTRPKYLFQYVCRVERGETETQRLHYHLIIYSDAPLDVLRNYCLKKWEYADWPALEASDPKTIEKSFQLVREHSQVSAYLAKYMSSKTSTELINTRNEMRGRITGTSRMFRPLPKCFRMKFDSVATVWRVKLKRDFIVHEGQIVRIGRWYRDLLFQGSAETADEMLKLFQNFVAEEGCEPIPREELLVIYQKFLVYQGRYSYSTVLFTPIRRRRRSIIEYQCLHMDWLVLHGRNRVVIREFQRQMASWPEMREELMAEIDAIEKEEAKHPFLHWNDKRVEKKCWIELGVTSSA